jgi:hypothetical protein
MTIPASEAPAASFIVNLSALPGPYVPEHLPLELEGLRPFISRRTRDGIHRFYLHVGFFHSLVEAETWLSGARAMYPNAFVSELADTLRPAEPGTPPFADTQVMRVLEVRAPRHDDEGSDTGSYSVQSEERVLGEPPADSPAAWEISAPLSLTPPANTPARPDVPKTPKATDAWSEVVAEVNNDSSSTSGVRHLRVEIQRPRNRSRKSPKERR